MRSFTTTQIIAKEGWFALFIAILLLILAVVADFGIYFMIFVLIFMLYIFRNPERIAYEDDPLAIIAPLDGKIIKIDRVKNDFTNNMQNIHVVIRSLPFDVGFVRFPIKGELVEAKTIHGLFLPPFNKLSKVLNERVDIRCLQNGSEFFMRVRAGMFCRKINLSNSRGGLISGARVAFMIDGSVELFLPITSRIKLSVGDYVKAGESVIGYFKYKEE